MCIASSRLKRSALDPGHQKGFVISSPLQTSIGGVECEMRSVDVDQATRDQLVRQRCTRRGGSTYLEQSPRHFLTPSAAIQQARWPDFHARLKSARRLVRARWKLSHEAAHFLRVLFPAKPNHKKTTPLAVCTTIIRLSSHALSAHTLACCSLPWVRWLSSRWLIHLHKRQVKAEIEARNLSTTRCFLARA
jgi:hypothetical protein